MNLGVACGGTGGHIFPGLATAKVLKRRGHDVTLWLAGRGVEGLSVKGWDGGVECVKASGLSGGMRSLVAVGHWFGAVRECRRRMKANRPQALLAMGSFASVGPVLAARSLGVPVVLHEANTVPGRAVQALSLLAHSVAITFDSTRGLLPRRRMFLTGLPIRDDLGERESGSGYDGPTILVMGGSQGAHRLNLLAAPALCTLKREGKCFRVTHLAGQKDEAWVRGQYQAASVDARVFGFVSEMGKVYNGATLAVARAGAASCMELAACGIPAIFVPLPTAVRNHQVGNARALEAVGAGICLVEPALTEAALARCVGELLDDGGRLKAMSGAMRKLAVPDGAERLADLVENIANEGAGT